MTVTIILVVWYLLGVVGCCLGCHTDWKNGSDFTTGDVVASVFVSLLGPVALLIALCYFLSRVEFTSKVLIKGKRNER